MKTEQERIEQMDKMAQVMCGFCTEDKRCVLRYSAPCSEVKSQDCSYKGNAEMLICAGYGDVSEYKAEIERLKAENERVLNKLAAVLLCIHDTSGTIDINKLIKQAKIEVLNELKKYLHIKDFDTPDERWKPESEFCAIIDELIKEVENSEKSSH